MGRAILLIVAILILSMATSVVLATSQYEADQTEFSSGAGEMASENYRLRGVIGEVAAGILQSDSFRLQSGVLSLINEPPTVTVGFPTANLALQDGVTLTATASDLSGVAALYFYVREPDGPQGKIIGPQFEDLAATLNVTTDKWEYNFDTLKLPDGYYVILAKGVDTYDNEGWSSVVSFSIRNWAVIELLPATPNNNPGRTMPIKFSLRVCAAVDPNQPFVYNDDLEIKIFVTKNPGSILQTSTFGAGALGYRIDYIAEKYVTNFQTLKTPMLYSVAIYRGDLLITNDMTATDSFRFETVKTGKNTATLATAVTGGLLVVGVPLYLSRRSRRRTGSRCPKSGYPLDQSRKWGSDS